MNKSFLYVIANDISNHVDLFSVYHAIVCL